MFTILCCVQNYWSAMGYRIHGILYHTTLPPCIPPSYNSMLVGSFITSLHTLMIPEGLFNSWIIDLFPLCPTVPLCNHIAEADAECGLEWVAGVCERQSFEETSAVLQLWGSFGLLKIRNWLVHVAPIGQMITHMR